MATAGLVISIVSALVAIFGTLWNARAVRQEARDRRDELEVLRRSATVHEQLAEKELNPILSVTKGPGWDSDASYVKLRFVARNDGGIAAFNVPVIVAIEGEGQFEGSTHVDLPPGESVAGTVEIPRQFVTSVAGAYPEFTGPVRLLLRYRGMEIEGRMDYDV